ncbi:twin-arginine translocation pathway signal [Rhodococcus sp. 14C212]|uniref:twin-arginine translocation pathway signal n=1 Tax=Rhodococcus sp. 14C212 TaxID=2711209 RepID=UPI0013EA2F56|nr:twin-arginine translocation pathway signal [Rhodococcus sp. 14C212]NGP04902.1 twin-arginine translocation pathway signal [Rhodococcus sp. 14C212]
MTENSKNEAVTLEKADDTAGVEGTTPPGSESGTRRLLLAALTAAAIVLAGLVGFGVYDKVERGGAEAARTEALQAAEEQAVAMLAYDHATVDEQVAAASDGLTGDFRDEYTNLMKNVIAPGAKEKSITVQVSVQASSVVSAEADRAVTLLFLNQITTSSVNPEAVSSGSRVRVELEKHDGRWLVSRLTPI